MLLYKSRQQAVHFYWYLCISQFISKEIARSTEKKTLSLSEITIPNSLLLVQLKFFLVKNEHKANNWEMQEDMRISLTENNHNGPVL